MEEKIHLKGLNGLRAIAALAVLFFHLNMSLHDFHLPDQRHIDLAGFGVSMFFSISGFLITFLLLREKTKQKIKIKYFYIRRILRIWPLYFLVLALSIITALIYGLDLHTNALPYYLFFLANVPFILDNGMPLLGPLWSLGVEEQFYIFWPWAVRSTQHILKFTFIFTAVYITLRIFLRWIDYKYNYSVPYLIIHVTRFDCMTIGAMGAILVQQQKKWFLTLSTHFITQILSWLVVVLLAFNKYHIASVIDQEIVSTITVFLIINLSLNPKTLVNMENKFFDFLGKISYGIYMYHMLAIFYSARIINQLNLDNDIRYVVIYTSVPFLTILVAWLSYRYFETPFLNRKSRYSVVLSSPSITSES